MTVDVIIVGGGIAGLAAAYELHRRGISFMVMERAPRPGGVIFSEEVNGFTIDAGPDALLIQKPDGIKLCQELGLGDRLVSTLPPRQAFVQRGGTLHPLPAASVLGIPTQVAPFVRTGLFSWPAKLRMGAELFVPVRREDTDESIGAFMTRRFGREATTYLAEPLLAGIHAGDVDRLSLRALFPRFAEAERKHGSLLRAFRREQKRRRSVLDTRERHGASVSASGGGAPREVNEGAFKSLPGGLSEIVRALVAALPAGVVHMSTAVARVSVPEGGGPFRVQLSGGAVHESRAVVCSTPAYVTAALVRDCDSELAHLCADVPYASIATVALALPREAVSHRLDGSGYVVPRVESSGILAATWLSSKWPHRAPKGTVLLRTFIGGARDPNALEHSDAELIARSLAAIRPVLAVRGDPLFSRVYRFERASPQHEVGHLDRLKAMERRLATHPGLWVTGSGFRGVGIPDCVADARDTAAQVSEWLRSQ